MAQTNVQAFSGDVAISSNLAVSGSKFTYDNTNTTVFTGTSGAAANEIGYLDMSTSSAANNIHVKIYIKYGNSAVLGEAEYSYYLRPNGAALSLIYDYRNQVGSITPVVYRTNANNLHSGGTAGVVRFGYSISSPQNVIWCAEVSQRFVNGTPFYPTNTGSAVVTTDLVQVTPAPFTRFDSNVAVNTNTLFVDSVGNKVGIGTTSPDSRLTVLAPNAVMPSLYNAEYRNGASIMVSENEYDVETARSALNHNSTIILSSDHAHDSGYNAGGSIGFAAKNEFGGYTVQYGQISGVREDNFYGGLSFSTMHNLSDGKLREDMRIINGNLGIGTNAPFGKLQVDIGNASAAGAVWDATKVIFGDINTNQSQGLAFGVTTDSHASIISLAPSVAWRGLNYYSSYNSWYINDVKKMCLENSGKLALGGIGGPTAWLEVYNAATAATTAADGLIADFTGPFIRIGDARTSRTFSSGTGIKFHDSGVANFSIGIKDSVLKLGQTSSDGNALFPGGGSDLENTLCLTTTGNVGLNSTTPATRIYSYKSDYTLPSNGTDFGRETTNGITFRSRIHSAGQNPAPSWYNSLAIDNIKMWYNPKSYSFVGNNQAGSHGVFNIGRGFVNDSQANTPVFTLTTNGRVGINREQPSYILDIAGSIRYTGTPGQNSDRRIKRNIVDVNDASALETIRLIKPKKYDYIDTESKDTKDTVWGFIAQEVREVLPYATDVINDYIPNFMTWANVVGSNVITIDTTKLLSNTGNIHLKDVFDKPHDVTIDEVIDSNSLRVLEDLSKFTGSIDASGNVITETQTITVTPEEYNALENISGYEPVIGTYTQTTIDDSNVSQTTTLTVEEYNALEDTTGWEGLTSNYTKTEIISPGSQIFVYGEYVNDFHVLKKDAIWTVTTAALQEVDRQQQSDKTRITELETQITSVLSRLDALES